MESKPQHKKSFLQQIILFVRKWFQLGVLFISLVVFGVIVCNRSVKDFSEEFVYSSVSEIPQNQVGLVLGTSKFAYNGGINPYFQYRMETAYELYHSGKLNHIIVSGDNHVKGYNEPQQMKDYLVQLGVDSSDITMDYAGFRTFDSMIRVKEVFGQTKVTVISQEFHNERAIFLARKNGIEAIAMNAKTPWYSPRMRLREYLAKCKAVLDVYVLKTTPKFLGEKIEISL
ncbi:MAG: ElyC/SanA/YdcF family protein [Flavobacteriales bacterium]